MDVLTIVGVASLFIVNIAGWIKITKDDNKRAGELNQRVVTLEHTISNGLTGKVDNISRHVATLEGKLDMYMEMRKDG